MIWTPARMIQTPERITWTAVWMAQIPAVAAALRP
jgi:hypothetical protein